MYTYSLFHTLWKFSWEGSGEGPTGSRSWLWPVVPLDEVPRRSDERICGPVKGEKLFNLSVQPSELDKIKYDEMLLSLEQGLTQCLSPILHVECSKSFKREIHFQQVIIFVPYLICYIFQYNTVPFFDQHGSSNNAFVYCFTLIKSFPT